MPLRSKLIIYAVVMLLLFLGLTIGSYLSLRAASRDAEEARQGLARLALVEALESHCGNLGPGADSDDCSRARKALADLNQEEWSDEPRLMLERLLALAAPLDEGRPPPDPQAFQAAVRHLREAIVIQARRDIRAAEKPTQWRAVRLLIASALAAIGGSFTFAWFYARLVRERKALEARVRRSEKLAALGTLAAGIAHEINNPLTTISMSAEALRERLGDSAEGKEYCEAIEEEAARCREIIDDLSDLARGGALDLEPVDPEELSREAVRIVLRNAALPKVELSAEVAANMPLISGDRGKLLQLLVNLIQNGIEATGEGGRVELDARPVNGHISIRIHDNGRGIGPDILERIFEPFYSDKNRGVGLGLTLCHRIAELHQGDLLVESDGPGRGSTFTLLLPLSSRGKTSGNGDAF
jgi:signal transduction histidine kinase